MFEFQCWGILHIGLCNKPLCKSNLTSASTDLATVLELSLHTGSVVLLGRKKGELICLLRLSKHLWVADKNTQEAMHQWMMKPQIPLLAQDQISSGLNLPQLLCSASFSSFSAVSVKPLYIISSKLEKEVTPLCFSNYRAFAVNYLYSPGYKILNIKQNLHPLPWIGPFRHKIFEVAGLHTPLKG